jgi:hypothetical protein
MQDVSPSALLAVVMEYMDKLGWNYIISDEKTMRFPISCENGKYYCTLIADDNRNFVCLYSVLPNYIPFDKRHDVSEFITRANYGMNIGNFELDFSDGEVRFKTSMTTYDQPPGDGDLACLVHTNIGTLDNYMKGIMGVVYGGKTPTEAIYEIEGPPRAGRDQ